MASKVQASVFIFDLKITNKQTATRKLEEILSSLKYGDKNNKSLIILLHAESRDDNNIQVAGNYFLDSTPLLVKEFIEDAISAEENANWFEAIKTACSWLDDLVLPGRNELTRKHIALITDFTSHAQDMDDTFYETIEVLKKSKAYLYILGPDVKYSKTMSYPIMDHLEITSIDHLDANSNEYKNLKIAKKLLVDVPGLISNLDLCVDMYLFHESFYPRMIQQNKLDFAGMQIPCKVHGQFIKLNQDISMKGTIHSTRMEFCYEHNNIEKVDPDNVSSGLMLHGQFIGFDKDLEESFKGDLSRVFKIIAFVKKNELSEYLMGADGTKAVTCSDELSDVFCSLITTLIKEDKVAIAKYNYRAGIEPNFYVLIPTDDLSFSMTLLSYIDDIKKFVMKGTQPDLQDDKKPNKEEIDSVYAFLEQHDVAENQEASLNLDLNLCVPPLDKLMHQRLKNKELNADFEENKVPFESLLNFVTVPRNNDILIPYVNEDAD